MQHPSDVGAHYYGPPDVQADHRTHRYRSFMIEEISTEHPEHKSSAPAGESLKFGVQALSTGRPFHNQSVLKADQANLLKFPSSPSSCTSGSPLSSAAPGSQVGPAGHHSPSDSHSRGKSEHGADGGGKSKKGRRSRTVFTESQLMGSEKRFEKQKYSSTPDRIDLAESLGLSQSQVKTWYQNRRMKWKKIVLQGGGSESPTKPKGRPKKNSIPSSEQLSEQERSAADAEHQSEGSSSHFQNTQEE